MQEPEVRPSYPSGEVVLQPLSPEDWPSVEHLVTEDGAPVDSVFSEKQMRLLTEPLYSSWKPGRPFVALANVGLFYGIDLPPLVPDVLLSINVRMPENLFPKLHRSYFVWKYGKPPEVVIEIVSNKKGGEDTEKIEKYTDVRVSNYFIYDPEGHLSDQAIRVYRLSQARLVPDVSGSLDVPCAGLGLTLWQGTFEETDATWLRWVDSDGKLIPTGAESASSAAERAEAESQRAEAESQRAEAESQRAEVAERRAEYAEREKARLLQLLKQNGIDPDSADL